MPPDARSLPEEEQEAHDEPIGPPVHDQHYPEPEDIDALYYTLVVDDAASCGVFLLFRSLAAAIDTSVGRANHRAARSTKMGAARWLHHGGEARHGMREEKADVDQFSLASADVPRRRRVTCQREL